MKRATIWALGVGMSLSFLVLLFLQINYMTRFVTLRKAQFDENVNRSLSEAVSNVELNESRLYLENLVRGVAGFPDDREGRPVLLRGVLRPDGHLME